jgi:hypothetical protein
MNRKVFYLRVLVGFLVLLMAAPPGIMAQSSGQGGTFSQEELDQMLAPIALYPDSLLAQLLVAATYPDQVVEADQWVTQNSNLKGDALNDAVDRKDWDLSVKALVPFPQVLAMMSDKKEWTQRMGDAFLAQQADVMDTIQRLRAKAHAQGNLKSTEQQKVVVRGDSIEIEPSNPRVVYVPTYNPTVIYGPWWHPAHPPYAYNPYYPHYAYDPLYRGVGFVTAGVFGFAAGIAVGSYWHSGWGRWDWHRHNVYVNVNRTVNINRTYIRKTDIRTSSWHDVNRNRVPQGSKTDAVNKTRNLKTSGKANVKNQARPTSDSVNKGLKQRENKDQVRSNKGKNAGQDNQGKKRPDSGNMNRGKSSGKSGDQMGRGKSSGEPRGDSLHEGGSNRRGDKSKGGGGGSRGGAGESRDKRE